MEENDELVKSEENYELVKSENKEKAGRSRAPLFINQNRSID
ncbi:MAG: hypothetical protein RL233_1557 [Bacteroidota bacterium]|jgi:hypothetical protein